MWSQYDENLSTNPFFKEINENHSDIIEESTVQSWIICIPRIGTIESSQVSPEIILDHVLVFPEENAENQYFTLSKKQITVKDKQIITDFDRSNTCVDILFEETFYINRSSKFIVWCIERPLFLKHEFCDSHSSKHLSNLHDCIDFLWCESLSHNILDTIKNLVATFIKNYELEIESLQSQKEVIGCLFSQCLQICYKNEVLKEKCMLNGQFLDKLKLAVESYMQYCLGRKLMFSINTVNHQKDGCLNKTIRNSSHIQYQHLGIENHFSDVILATKSQLNQINSFWTVLDKIECLKKTLDVIFQSGQHVSHITSDDVLQILVFVILKLNINNWFSNLSYINEFQLSLEKSNEIIFCITTFEAAIEFISSSKFWDIKNNFQEHPKPADIAIDFLEKKLKSGDVKVLSNLSLVSDNEFIQGLCHPLCTCANCQSIMKQNNDPLFNKFIPFGEISEQFLIFATCLDKLEVVQYLLNRGVDINVTDYFGKTSLHYAAGKGLQTILLLLINKKADVNLIDKEKNSPLHLASLNGHENCIKALLYSSPEVELNVGNSFGDTPLILAARWGYLDIVKILLENGASVIIKNKRNQSVFDVAPNFYISRLCDKYSVRQIRKSDKIIELDNLSLTSSTQNYCKSHGIRPKTSEQFKKIELLLKSIENNDFPLTCYYLGYSNNTQIAEGGNCHPLCVCDKCKNEQLDEYQEDSNHSSVNVNMCDPTGYTPLHVAAKFGRTEILRLLLDNGALPNVKTFRTLYTPLHLACIEGRVQTVREMVKCGDCKIDTQDAKGNTPLYYATAKGNSKIVEILLANGADCNKKNLSDKSALMLSEENMQYGIFRILKNNLQSILDKDTQASSTDNLF